jgi:hydrogenase nickel incorporation protein HypB
MVLTKTDLLPHVPFDLEQARLNAQSVHPGIEIVEVSNTTANGLDNWLFWIARRRQQTKQRLCAVREKYESAKAY